MKKLFIDNLVRIGIEDGTEFPSITTSDYVFESLGYCPYMTKKGVLKLKGVDIKDVPNEVREYVTNEKFYDWCIFAYKGYIIMYRNHDGYLIPFVGNSYRDTYGGSFKIEGCNEEFYYPQCH